MFERIHCLFNGHISTGWLMGYSTITFTDLKKEYKICICERCGAVYAVPFMIGQENVILTKDSGVV